MTTSPSVVKMVVTVAMEMGKMSGTIARDQVTRTSREYVVKWMGSHHVVDQRVGLHEQGDLSSTCLLFHCPSHFVASLCIPPSLPVCLSVSLPPSPFLSSLPSSLSLSLPLPPSLPVPVPLLSLFVSQYASLFLEISPALRSNFTFYFLENELSIPFFIHFFPLI